MKHDEFDDELQEKLKQQERHYTLRERVAILELWKDHFEEKINQFRDNQIWEIRLIITTLISVLTAIILMFFKGG